MIATDCPGCKHGLAGACRKYLRLPKSAAGMAFRGRSLNPTDVLDLLARALQAQQEESYSQEALPQLVAIMASGSLFQLAMLQAPLQAIRLELPKNLMQRLKSYGPKLKVQMQSHVHLHVIYLGLRGACWCILWMPCR